MNAASDDTPAALVIAMRWASARTASGGLGTRPELSWTIRHRYGLGVKRAKYSIRDQESMTLGPNSAFCGNKLHSFGLFN